MSVGQLPSRLLTRAGGHPLIASWLALFFGIALVLGVMHETRIFGRCLVVLIQEVKHEYAALKGVGREVMQELRTPSEDSVQPEKKPVVLPPEDRPSPQQQPPPARGRAAYVGEPRVRSLHKDTRRSSAS